MKKAESCIGFSFLDSAILCTVNVKLTLCFHKWKQRRSADTGSSFCCQVLKDCVGRALCIHKHFAGSTVYLLSVPERVYACMIIPYYMVCVICKAHFYKFSFCMSIYCRALFLFADTAAIPAPDVNKVTSSRPVEVTSAVFGASS